MSHLSELDVGFTPGHAALCVCVRCSTTITTLSSDRFKLPVAVFVAAVAALTCHDTFIPDILSSLVNVRFVVTKMQND